MSEQLEFVIDIARRLDSKEIRYMFTGSIALVFYAAPRMTRDIDLVVELSTLDGHRFIDLFANDCYIDESAVNRALAEHGIFNIIHNRLILKADFIVKKSDEYRVGEFERRRPVDLDGQRVYLVSPEDLILSKLVWGKASCSELQLRDIQNLLRSVGSIDYGYLKKWARFLDVESFYQRASSNE